MYKRLDLESCLIMKPGQMITYCPIILLAPKGTSDQTQTERPIQRVAGRRSAGYDIHLLAHLPNA